MKDCFIELEKSSVDTTVVVCRKPLVRDCEGTSGEVVCSTQYETQCSTKHTVIQVGGLKIAINCCSRGLKNF